MLFESAVWFAIICNLLAAFILFNGALSYGLNPVPMPHHIKMFRNASIEVTPVLRLLMRSFYRAIATSLLGLSIAVVVLSLGPILQNALWAKLLVFVLGLLMSGGAIFLPREVEQLTGVQTPWRKGVAMGFLFLCGFLCALLADDRVRAFLS